MVIVQKLEIIHTFPSNHISVKTTIFSHEGSTRERDRDRKRKYSYYVWDKEISSRASFSHNFKR